MLLPASTAWDLNAAVKYVHALLILLFLNSCFALQCKSDFLYMLLHSLQSIQPNIMVADFEDPAWIILKPVSKHDIFLSIIKTPTINTDVAVQCHPAFHVDFPKQLPRQNSLRRPCLLHPAHMSIQS